MPKQRAVLSPRNKYWISKHRFYELCHYCYQYDEWLDEYKTLNAIAIKGLDYDKPPADPYAIGDATANIATRMAVLLAKMEMVEQTAEEADDELAKYIIRAVTKENVTFNYLLQFTDISKDCRDRYYESRRKFYWLLSKKL